MSEQFWTIAPGFPGLEPDDLPGLVKGASYTLACGSGFGPGTIHHALASAVLLIADLTARVDGLEGRGQRASEYAAARVGREVER
jgi:hypothetical protein